MKAIKGLLIKDFMQVKKDIKILLIVAILFIIITVLNKDFEDCVYYIPMLFSIMLGMVTLNSFSYDEKSKFEKYALASLCSKKELVLEKYVLSSIISIVGIVSGILISVIINLIYKFGMPGISDILYSGANSLLTIIFLYSFQFPSIYKYGFEKGKMYSIVIAIFSIIAFIALINILGNMFDFNFSFVNELNDFVNIAVIVIFAICMFLISYKISLKIVKNKDY